MENYIFQPCKKYFIMKNICILSYNCTCTVCKGYKQQFILFSGTMQLIATQLLL